MNVICFHNPNEENGYLSNWYLSELIYGDIKFSSMEQYMMYKKAICFNDEYIADKILSIDDVEEIKELGRAVKDYNDTIWNGLRQIIVYNGLLEKFKQNEDLKAKLKSTNDSILAECAVRDRMWGIGLSMHDPDRLDIRKWKGQNLLGFALMKVRESL